MKPYIRKHFDYWVCASYEDTLKYFIDKSVSFEDLNHKVSHRIGSGSCVEKAYQAWKDNVVWGG